LEGSKFVRTHEIEVSIEDDQGLLRQDRYSLHTAPKFLGPQIEDIPLAFKSITQECNLSTFSRSLSIAFYLFLAAATDNPLVDGESGHIHHGGNFQAMAVTNAMEKTRLALHHIGKLLFAQSTELVNTTMNCSLPPSLSATNPSLNYHSKGIVTAAYISELGHLANPI